MPLAVSGGKQQARFFQFKEAAQQHAAMINGERRGPVEEFLKLDPSTQDRMMRALRALQGDGQALEDAAVDWARNHAGKSEMTVAQLVEACLQAKREAGLRPRSLGNLKCSLETFQKDRENRKVVAVTTQEIADWLGSQGWSATTRRGRLVDVRTLFNFAVAHEWVRRNPADGVQKPKSDQTAPGILKVEDVEKLMRTAEEHDRGLIPYLALCIFGGLRPEQEARGMTWDRVRNGTIVINAETAKGRKKRLVEINATLRAWLDIGGDLPVKNLKKRLERVRALAQVPWSHDCMRHSYASYALPVWGSAKVANWSGHGEAVLHSHYKELVEPAEAERFWAVMPKQRQGD